jgi:hypothetical protein
VTIVWCSAFLALEIVELTLGVSFLAVLSKAQIIFSVAVLGVPQYFFLLHKQRYKKIVRQFESESPRHRRIGIAMVLGYIFALFLAGMAGAILRGRVLGR